MQVFGKVSNKDYQMQKRYEYWGSNNGVPTIKWTDWFSCTSKEKEPFQVKNKLRNEYRD